ncbi:hypothetical protein LXL04_025788 [Taraxacum kok-saghyz]
MREEVRKEGDRRQQAFPADVDHRRRNSATTIPNSHVVVGTASALCELSMYLPTQYYMAVLYLVTTLALTSQALYYGYFCDQNTSKRKDNKIESANKKTKVNQEESTVPILPKSTPSLQIPSADYSSPPERIYYTSARSLTRSHTPTNFFHRTTTTPICDQDSVHEPLIGATSPPTSQPKPMLCVVFIVGIFRYASNLKLEENSYLDSIPNEGIVIQVGRKLLQVNEGSGSIGIGTFLGWGMAAIYMGGRFPQIFLNVKIKPFIKIYLKKQKKLYFCSLNMFIFGCVQIRRGHVQGLNPLMFVFALLGNSTYVARVIVKYIQQQWHFGKCSHIVNLDLCHNYVQLDPEAKLEGGRGIFGIFLNN